MGVAQGADPITITTHA